MVLTTEKALVSTLKTQMTWPLRPVMTSLNGDQSWLLSFPRPSTDTGAKFYHHIVLEPWLNGPMTILSSWIINIALKKPPQIPDVEAIEAVASQIETSAKSLAEAHNISRPISTSHRKNEYNGMIDTIVLFFHYVDHCHEPTLRLFDKRIPVVATPEANSVVEKMKHFDSISLIPYLHDSAETWRAPEQHPASLPTWLTAVKCLGHHELNFVGAMVWTHEARNGEEVHEALLMSPHGVRLDAKPVQAFLNSKPQTIKLAMLHGLKESWAIGSMNTFGAAAGLALYRKMGGAKYWIKSHDSLLGYTGIFMHLAWVYDVPRTIEWAMGQEKLDEKESLEKPNVVEIENGHCLVLA